MTKINEIMQLLPHTIKNIQKKPSDVIPQGVRMVNAYEHWKDKKEDVVVAVIDSGVDYKHNDLKNNVIGGKDFTGKGDYLDDNGHGTHVAGTICASANDFGIVGVAPHAKILALKTLNENGYGDMTWTLHALEYAIEQKVDVINMSLGGTHHEYLHMLVKEATNRGIHVVCASGNAGDGNIFTQEKSFPAFYPEAISVGAVDFDKNIAVFSSTNKNVDILAYGVDILSTYPNEKYAVLSGTSMATPHVAGAIALLKSSNPKDYHNGDLILDVTKKDKEERKIPIEFYGQTFWLPVSLVFEMLKNYHINDK